SAACRISATRRAERSMQFTIAASVCRQKIEEFSKCARRNSVVVVRQHTLNCFDQPRLYTDVPISPRTNDVLPMLASITGSSVRKWNSSWLIVRLSAGLAHFAIHAFYRPLDGNR